MEHSTRVQRSAGSWPACSICAPTEATSPAPESISPSSISLPRSLPQSSEEESDSEDEMEARVEAARAKREAALRVRCACCAVPCSLRATTLPCALGACFAPPSPRGPLPAPAAGDNPCKVAVAARWGGVVREQGRPPAARRRNQRRALVWQAGLATKEAPPKKRVFSLPPLLLPLSAGSAGAPRRQRPALPHLLHPGARGYRWGFHCAFAHTNCIEVEKRLFGLVIQFIQKDVASGGGGAAAGRVYVGGLGLELVGGV